MQLVDMKELQDQVVRRLLKVGAACAPDLANEVEFDAGPDELIEALQALKEKGVVRPVEGTSDRNKYQVVYELSR
jgi:hypothetical protein